MSPAPDFDQSKVRQVKAPKIFDISEVINKTKAMKKVAAVAHRRNKSNQDSILKKEFMMPNLQGSPDIVRDHI